MKTIALITLLGLGACAPGQMFGGHWDKSRPNYSQTVCKQLHDHQYGAKLAQTCPAA